MECYCCQLCPSISHCLRKVSVVQIYRIREQTWFFRWAVDGFQWERGLTHQYSLAAGSLLVGSLSPCGFSLGSLFNCRTLSSSVSAGLLRAEAQLLGADVVSLFLWRSLSGAGFSSWSLSCLACPLLTPSVYTAVSGPVSSLWRTAKGRIWRGLCWWSQWCGSLVPDFANMGVSGVLKVTLIFITSPKSSPAYIESK